MQVEIAFPAKTTRPKLSGVFPRTRLFRLLDRSPPILWVSGPPGSGKTTLAVSYLNARRLPTLWYQVDAGDADVATFFHYLRQAVRQTAPRRRTALPLLTPDSWLQLSSFTRRYFRELYRCLKTPWVLVVDNYQEVPAHSRLHEVIAEGLSEIPAKGRVIILSREDPPHSSPACEQVVL
jgi:ATP/maltotriose-dependent transcriptional regulator MalT